MIVPDINLLIYAYDEESPFHEKAARWWKDTLSGEEPVGLPQVVVFGFVRVSTNPGAFRRPMTPAEASGHVRSWTAQPVVSQLDVDASHVEAVLKSLDGLGTAGNLVTDAQIAAVAIVHDAVVHTTDTDFIRFTGLRWFNPISGVGSRGLRKQG